MPLGLILLALGCWRTHALSGWQAALISVGPLLGAIAGEGPIGALITLPVCLGMLIAARRLATPPPNGPRPARPWTGSRPAATRWPGHRTPYSHPMCRCPTENREPGRLGRNRRPADSRVGKAVTLVWMPMIYRIRASLCETRERACGSLEHCGAPGLHGSRPVA